MHRNYSMARPPLWLAGLALVLVAAACSPHRPARDAGPKGPATADPPPAPSRLATARWSAPYEGPLGFPKGAQRTTVSIDPGTGGETYYARFPAGSRFEAHWHAHAEYAVLLSGRVIHTLGHESYSLEPGDYVVVPPRIPHGWTVDAGADAYLLIRRDGPADFNFVGR